jgi:hypothetical protein
MKVASAATLAIIASGEYLKVELWQVSLNAGAGPNYYYTAGDVPLTFAGHTYVRGLTFVRDRIEQNAGFQVGTHDLTVSPQLDLPGGQVQIAGGNFLPQCVQGVLDNAVWTLSKAFLAFPGSGNYYDQNGTLVYTAPALGNQIDTSPGLVPWWQGITDEVQCGRFSADITLSEATAILAKQMMPRNMIQAGCVHTFCDAGCTLHTGQNTYSGTVATVPAGQPNQITTNLNTSSYPDHYFDQGILTFTSGPLSGVQYTIQTSFESSGLITTVIPFPQSPVVGSTFTALVGCNKSQQMCASGKFKLPGGSYGSNILHYRGAPFVPNPETLYDGGAMSPTSGTVGSQGGGAGGSPYSGNSQ